MRRIDARDRRLALGLFALMFVSYAYFYQGGGWNENSRMDLVRAIVDDHTLNIDRYHTNTGDKARFGGHFYSDKAPGLSIVAAPLYAVLSLGRSLFASEHDFIVFASWILTAVIVGGASAVTSSLLYLSARRMDSTRGAAALTAVAYGLGTIAFPLSTLFFGHQVAAAMLFSAFYLAWLCRERYADRLSILVALLATFAGVVEFPAAPAAIALLVYHARPPRARRRAASFLIAAALPAVVLGGYLFASFDSPLRVGYQLLAEPTAKSGMLGHGVLGLTYPKADVLFELVFGTYRGLLPYSPVLALAVPGFFAKTCRHERLLSATIVVYFLLFVASYEWWQGGSSFGSRHLAPMLPFLALQIGYVANRLLSLSAVVTAISVGFLTVVTAVQPKPSERLEDPFFSVLWPAFKEGRLAQNNVCPFSGRARDPTHRPLSRRTPYDAFNVGMLLGGHGKRSLAPLFGLWLASAFAIVQAARRPDDEGDGSDDDPDEKRSKARAARQPEH